jgi:hypothetical protein
VDIDNIDGEYEDDDASPVVMIRGSGSVALRALLTGGECAISSFFRLGTLGRRGGGGRRKEIWEGGGEGE